MNARTPYDKGTRAEPVPWAVRKAGGEWRAGSMGQRPADWDDFGRVDFDDDAGQTLATVYASQGLDERGHLSGHWVMEVYLHDESVAVKVVRDGTETLLENGTESSDAPEGHPTIGGTDDPRVEGNAIMAAIADILSDRGDDEAAEWVRDHAADDGLYDYVGKLVDQFQRFAIESIADR